MSSRPVSDSRHPSSEGPSYGPSLKSFSFVGFFLHFAKRTNIVSDSPSFSCWVLSAPPRHIVSSSSWEPRKSFAFVCTNWIKATEVKGRGGPARHYEWDRNRKISLSLQRRS